MEHSCLGISLFSSVLKNTFQKSFFQPPPPPPPHIISLDESSSDDEPFAPALRFGERADNGDGVCVCGWVSVGESVSECFLWSANSYITYSF